MLKFLMAICLVGFLGSMAHADANATDLQTPASDVNSLFYPGHGGGWGGGHGGGWGGGHGGGWGGGHGGGGYPGGGYPGGGYPGGNPGYPGGGGYHGYYVQWVDAYTGQSISGWQPSSAPVCGNGNNCACGGQNYCGQFGQGQQALYWDRGCWNQPRTIICEVQGR